LIHEERKLKMALTTRPGSVFRMRILTSLLTTPKLETSISQRLVMTLRKTPQLKMKMKHPPRVSAMNWFILLVASI
jgi:hypothetical protein